MKADFEQHRDVFGPLMGLQLHAWASCVYAQVRFLDAAGLRPTSHTIGDLPQERQFRGGRARFVGTMTEARMLDELPDNYERMRFFDSVAAEYRSAVEPFTAPIFESVLRYLAPRLGKHTRVLDVGCGPGREAATLAGRLPEGEVVACDLSTNMVHEAWKAVKEQQLRSRTAVFQLAAEDLPEEFTACFDVVVCNLAFQYFTDGEAVARSFRRVLAADGMAFVTDPGPDWFISMATPFASQANPAFIRYRNGEEFRTLFLDAGFTSVCWVEILPGMGLTIASV
ncbi:MAG: methyltransferase domain-containing protein [Bacteroidetes bacterium]|nr:methyltransferase domain-containing protein [Bacteroidota bacterium]